MSDESIFQRCDDEDELYFTSVSDTLLRNSNMSIESRWLVAYMLTHDKNFACSLKFIRESQKIGRERMTKLMKEAESHGYVKRVIFKNERNLLRTKFIVSSLPKFKINSPTTGFGGAGVPRTGESAAKSIPTKVNRERETREALLSSIEESEPVKSHGAYVKLKDSEVAEMVDKWGEPMVSQLIEDVNAYCMTSRTQGYANYAKAMETYYKRMSEAKKQQISNPITHTIDRKKKNMPTPSDVQKNALEAKELENQFMMIPAMIRGLISIQAHHDKILIHRGMKSEEISYTMTHDQFMDRIKLWKLKFSEK